MTPLHPHFKTPPPSSPPHYRLPEVEYSPPPSPLSTSNAATYPFSFYKTLSSLVLVTTFIALLIVIDVLLRPRLRSPETPYLQPHRVDSPDRIVDACRGLRK
ncbi:hypothetical protein POM88_038482 [Heracleum sosnowskyi]|uniref:Uncharacterized protein n=1 Tax=Heracleum sosnowskyi TaxID=360622 RepID=A0AAD8HAG2_9APIA|nr:hypothetical protein POM88_038482 [Heracleum sosnowskyi]